MKEPIIPGTAKTAFQPKFKRGDGFSTMEVAVTDVTLTGVLCWQAKERRSDRYGGLMVLNGDGPTECESVGLEPLHPLVGRHVKIVAKVLEARESYHIGDLFRQIFPKTPKVGQVFELGTGTIIEIDRQDEPEQFIFRRDGVDENDSDWIDPRLLYQLHNQTVELVVTGIQ